MSGTIASVADRQAIRDITALLRDLAGNHPGTLNELFARGQSELRRVAHRARLDAGGGPTLSTTALINEVWLKLNHENAPVINDRRHFFALAARAMRQVLVSYARERGAEKRGSGAAALPLDAATEVGEDAAAAAQALELGDALDRLEAVRPRLAQVVYLRFYAGLGDSEIGELLEVEAATVRRDWIKARAWLFRRLHPDATS